MTDVPSVPAPRAEDLAAAMWQRTHDGRWEDRGDGQDDSRVIYLADAEVALEWMRKNADQALCVTSTICRPEDQQS